MKTGKALFFWTLHIFGVLVFAYVASFWFFQRSHMTTGIQRGGGTTTVFWSVEETPSNRALMAFYSPLRNLPWFDLSVEWY
jgi:hypothetical protein